MDRVPNINRWQEGQVDCTREHFELSFEPTIKFESDWRLVPVSLGGPTPGSQL
jgi:hypothetical protein